MPKPQYFPNLFIPGAAKSGTSTLHNLLHQHPDICMSTNKEPFYFVNEDFESDLNLYDSKYHDLFTNLNTRYKGESSTSYMLFPNFIENVKKHVDESAKFIFILRNPVDRIYSHYWYLKGIGSETKGFREAVLKDMDEEPNIHSRLPEGRFKHYYQYGLYAKWLAKFYDSFEKTQIKVVLFEDLKESPLDTLNQCLGFLELKKLETIENTDTNKTVVLKYPYIYKSIQHVVSGKSKLLKPIHKIIPENIKTHLRNNASEYVIKMTDSKKGYSKLSINDREWISQLYKDDYVLLKELVEIDFNKWTDFNQFK
ncbi:sulfotransferase [Psychroserpens sp. SPM9]|uniref:sulfotransferase family protein n=1 Tax=Psychroserpens sp. SPM9 TaxID=2975598 RepID=UPI0021A785EB|nr:sulfotransferase [Psychroserpens sp. SPM9]MDG5492651.1 sulfotransferase [Psychroserpens sp. SPM9]